MIKVKLEPDIRTEETTLFVHCLVYSRKTLASVVLTREELEALYREIGLTLAGYEEARNTRATLADHEDAGIRAAATT